MQRTYHKIAKYYIFTENVPVAISVILRVMDYFTPGDTTSEKFTVSYITEKIPLVTAANGHAAPRPRLLIYRAVRINRSLEKCHSQSWRENARPRVHFSAVRNQEFRAARRTHCECANDAVSIRNFRRRGGGMPAADIRDARNKGSKSLKACLLE